LTHPEAFNGAPRVLVSIPMRACVLFFLSSVLLAGCGEEFFGCGDGAKSSQEACDDGNLVDGDGCSALCTIEIGSDCGPPALLAPNALLQLCNLSGQDLSGANLENANLDGANLINANISGANLSGANLTNAGLIFANATGTDFTNAAFNEANLTGANLTDALLLGVALQETNLNDTNFTNADLTGASGQPFNADSAIYINTTCPNGTNSDTANFTCIDQGFILR
jgi:cysteine-rich repeat protein